MGVVLIVLMVMMPWAVILNEVKNLEVSVAVVGSASLEILRCTQDDIEASMARRCFALLSMTQSRPCRVLPIAEIIC